MNEADFVYHVDKEGNLVGAGFRHADTMKDLAVPAGLFVRFLIDEEAVEEEWLEGKDKEDEEDEEPEEDDEDKKEYPVIDTDLYDHLLAMVHAPSPKKKESKKNKKVSSQKKTKKRRKGI
jgi:outer membrane biosynthesis protein TonB